MSALTVADTELTMSSREIAEVVEKRHDNVRRTIGTLLARGTIGVPQIEEYLDTLGRKAKELRVNKRDSYVIVAQLSPEFTARLVDRWQELEKQVSQPQVPQSFSEALRLAADTQEQLEKTEQEKQAAQKRVGTYQQVVGQHEQSIGRIARTFPGRGSSRAMPFQPQ